LSAVPDDVLDGEGEGDPHGSEGDGGESVQPSEPTATITRAELIDRVADKLAEEGTPPFTARVLATIFATSSELSDMLAALDKAGGLPGIGGILGAVLGRKGRKT